MFSEEDKIQLNDKNISITEAEKQIKYFQTGFPFLKITSIASVNNGITTFSAQEKDSLINTWSEYCNADHSIIKFVPASGAASRMFKDLFSFLEEGNDKSLNEFLQTFIKRISQFAFYSDLDTLCVKQSGKNIKELVSSEDYKTIVSLLLNKEGLNYGYLPKGLLKFHSYLDKGRTPIEEHLVEGCIYAKSNNKNVNIHFTVSPEHRKLFEKLVDKVEPVYEEDYDVKFNISFSEQKKETDTIAVNEDNTPFKEKDGILFRPGGHGSLIENLNDLNADIIFIKNIDNVVPDSLKQQEALWKKALAGCLVKIQKQCFDYLELIESENYQRDELLNILHFLRNTLHIKNTETKYLEDAELVIYLKTKLNRPIRVCGMVKNIGEPGGGPFFTVNKDNTVSLQILESSQIDLRNNVYKELFESGTHFNPVDIVCATKDYKGQKFDLRNYIDTNTGFISSKSKNGKTLKALERPGLWNGAMSDWSTIFVEVPLETFNPVKTINDLLREQHQGS